jgi:uncharacterized protein
MSLVEAIENDFKKAMLDRNKDLANLLRLLKAGFKNEMINLKVDELSDEKALSVITHEAKKRKDSIEQFNKGNRPDLAEIEQSELDLIKKYLPEQMSEDELRKIVEEVVGSMGSVAPSQFGAVMGQVMGRVKGKADGNMVSSLVKETLSK